MKSLIEYISEAEKGKTAMAHFNISNIEGLWGVFKAAKSLNVPVIIGVSEGEREFIGTRQAVALVKSLREEHNFPIFINADHTYKVELVKEAIDAGFDMVIYDGAQLSFDENARNTKECVQYARLKNPAILVEAELGFIGSGSNIKEGIPEGAGVKTNPEEAKKFVQATGVDLLAPSVGNIHGIVKGGNPHIDGELVKKIRSEAGVPLVLHGGSGMTDEDFIKGIDSGISIIHISTELRVAFKQALKLSLQENPDEITPYKIMKPAVLAIQKVAENRLKLFNKLS
jgi:fructose-bisphosphate aldolase class II